MKARSSKCGAVRLWLCGIMLALAVALLVTAVCGASDKGGNQGNPGVFPPQSHPDGRSFCGASNKGGHQGNPGVFPPQSHPYGRSYGEWGAAWQQWVFTTTTENCPVTDNTGARALVNQSGHVYFLAGTFGELPDTPWAAPNPVTRNVTIPTGIALCIPISNWGLCYPEDLPDVPPEDAVATMYEWLNAYYDPMPEADLECEVDGAAVKNLLNYRAQSDPFEIYVPADNVENDLMRYFTGDPNFSYAEGWHLSISDGFYVMLAPLSAGKHTIHLRCGPADSPFLDVYYNLTVRGGKEAKKEDKCNDRPKK
jgi:hypothetical protein